jgi:hypothetical protein
MKMSSNPKMCFRTRAYVRKLTVMTDRTQNMLDNTKMARGRPVRGMLLMLGSTVDSIATCVLGK